ncbi:hypothetical protein [Thalassospira xiamenensis]|uniref:Uncharacterized protein n=1 Tax=Thalassospira xiamenensis TaxID=220697 RepID=A0A285RUT0_9PROT|nr:hypothetical protein [Thalassospira xiamenensis]SOB96142.1 hypothetical protein SAMN05428964_1011797 [Thalassospira xiamenensis]
MPPLKASVRSFCKTAGDPSSITATIAIAASDYVQYSILMPLLDVLRVEAPGGMAHD